LRWNWGKLNCHFAVAIENIKPKKLQLCLSLISNILNKFWPIIIVLIFFWQTVEFHRIGLHPYETKSFLVKIFNYKSRYHRQGKIKNSLSKLLWFFD
jgi:hypothetical protein